MMDAEPAAPSAALLAFLEQRHPNGASDDAHHARVLKELQAKMDRLQDVHRTRISALRAARALGGKICDAGRVWARSLTLGANAAQADDETTASTLVRALDRRLLSLTLAGFAEIECVGAGKRQ
jgi:hypothetical protein